MTTGHLWQKAAAFAARAHRDQLRKDGRTPYFSHPVRVAMTVASVFACTDEQVLAAALLHDVIEDTTTDYDDLLKHFGRHVADIVSCLSKDKRMVEHDREIAYDQRLAASSWEAKLIKLADVYDNLADALDGDSRKSLLERGSRALKVAGNDPQLGRAVDAVSGAMRAAEAGSAKG